MKKERFYYSDELFFSNLEVLLNKFGNIVASGTIQNSNKRFPRVTICGIWDEEANTMTFGVTRCSKSDMFNKNIGRTISRERALNTPYKIVQIEESEKVSDVFLDNARAIEYEVMSMEYPIKIVTG